MESHLMSRFTGKVVVVTGAGGGIGRATAARLAAEGASLVLVDRVKQALDETRAVIERAGVPVVAVEADVTQWSDVQRYVAAASERFGGIDAFFNNAGILGAVSPLTEYPEAEFDRVLAVNVKGVWLGMKAVAPAMAARGGGAIVNTASIAGLRGSPNLIAYTASKHAVVGLTRSAAIELVRRGIRVNAVCPAPIETPMARELEQGFARDNPARAHERFAASIPMRRFGEPDEVAALVVFLLSSDAAYINGGIYTVDGGSMA
jgi:NAD(P)-dependent dehydrogenase (short-subunit alcohol dehydrogenase family)